MNIASIIVIIIVVALVVLAFWVMRKKKGCSCGCSRSCKDCTSGNCPGCRKQKNDSKEP